MKWNDSLPSDWSDARPAPPVVATGLDVDLLGVGARSLRVDLDDWI